MRFVCPKRSASSFVPNRPRIVSSSPLRSATANFFSMMVSSLLFGTLILSSWLSYKSDFRCDFEIFSTFFSFLTENCRPNPPDRKRKKRRIRGMPQGRREASTRLFTSYYTPSPEKSQEKAKAPRRKSVRSSFRFRFSKFFSKRTSFFEKSLDKLFSLC